MIKKQLAIAMLCAGMFSIFPNHAQAGLWDKKTIVSFSQPVEVPGAVLPAGKYVMKLVSANQADRHVVQFTNERENHVFATTIAIPVERPEYAEKTIITFYEMPQGQPEVMKTWFYPGEKAGQEFLYPKDRALLISAASAQPVATDIGVVQAEPQTQAQVSTPPPDNDRDINRAVEEAVAPAPEVATAPEVAPAPEEPVVIAQNNAPARNDADDQIRSDINNQPAPPVSNELPKTAGELPIIGLLGVLSLGAAAAFKRRFVR